MQVIRNFEALFEVFDTDRYLQDISNISQQNNKQKNIFLIVFRSKSVMDSKSTTVLTNLQRGNIEAKISSTITLNFYEKCAQGQKIKLRSSIPKYFINFFAGEVSDDEIRFHEEVNKPDSESGFTALHWACHYGQLKTAEKLLEFGSDLNALAANFIAPIHLAAACGHHEIVRLLINKGVNINQMEICGNTPLHYSAANNFPHSTNEILSSTEADVFLENEDGKTAYHLAVENKAYLAQAVIENFVMNVIS